MEFTYTAYSKLINLLKENKYVIRKYDNWDKNDKCVILRHDVDYDIDKALHFAEYEDSIGVKSTYFVLVTSDFYNIFSRKNEEILRNIYELGHDVGLHFDETKYNNANTNDLIDYILCECEILSNVIGAKVKCVSMHRPSEKILNENFNIPNIINSYGGVFFKEFKYVSDSRCRWREPVLDYIKNNEFHKLHILTHPFWYGEQNESIDIIVKRFIRESTTDRYKILNDNITDLDSIVKLEDI